MYRYNSHKESRFSQSESDSSSLEVLLYTLEQEKQWSRFDFAVISAQWTELKRLDDEKLHVLEKELLTDPKMPFSIKKNERGNGCWIHLSQSKHRVFLSNVPSFLRF
ncbi:unnamed protein product [Albugo candida]|uniref:Uncharacterized protein n=1 Tax=Albugo candida TaxID=65357 RepID=A0A024FUT1_9STRA|nr:unnamed protein product [Albugo candida]|eukprot:CCI10677.1 unnamed protein product [Albugo candida]